MKRHWIVRAAGWKTRAEAKIVRASPVICLVAGAYFAYAIGVASQKAWRGWVLFGVVAVAVVWGEWMFRQARKEDARESVRRASEREAELARACALAGAGERGLRLRQGCQICGGSPIAVAAGSENGVVVAVCGACGFGWMRGTGSIEEMLSPSDWCARVGGRLAPASRSAAVEAFGVGHVVEIAPGEWIWDWQELSDWADGVRAEVLMQRAEQHGRSGPMV